MLVNHDLSLRALVTADEYEWVSSPQSGVHRVMLDRIGTEQARATSVVRYDAGSDFPAHLHPDGEAIFSGELVAGAELLVLGGEITEGAGNYSTGSWLRLPAGTLTELVSGKAGALLYIKTGHLAGQKTLAVTQ